MVVHQRDGPRQLRELDDAGDDDDWIEHFSWSGLVWSFEVFCNVLCEMLLQT